MNFILKNFGVTLLLTVKKSENLPKVALLAFEMRPFVVGH